MYSLFNMRPILMDESTVVQAFAKRLVAARIAKGLTQAQLGEKLSVSQQTVAEWEAGRGFPRRSRREQLAELLGIDVGLPPRYAFVVTNRMAREGEAEVEKASRVLKEHFEQLLPEDKSHSKIYVKVRPSPDSAMEAAFREALPENLRQYCEASLPFGPNRFFADYMSDKVVAELKINSMLSPDSLYASLWRLVTLAKLAKDHRRFVLIAIPSKIRFSISQRIQAEAWLHGIEIHVANSPEHAAQIIVALENGNELGENPPETPPE